ncbi:LodA/GoxA family CTQ-dependent oxidase [Paludisphaera rhizosphaerae]|uniref:LodA/GoxA family CTQ-dependent oxidase n=1 Tax=Paludisphaera rhizosphaerae TaxID=2711216 RepID=UPI0013EA9BBF|nr:LodA/GoxA family CTQ-dependent oxidase [Paludisphaera rhizosphaerae]
MPTTFEIHPAIGVARVGTSDSFFLGPEPGEAPPSQYRDDAGALLRQAARFRVYKCERNDAGALIGFEEVKPADAKITWTVHVVNRKGAAKRFAAPGFRNSATPNDDAANAALIIDPGPRTFVGTSQPVQTFDGGKFQGVSVPLGAAHTDEDGRLIVVGGTGTSDSVPAQPNPARPIQGFADSDGWFDDTSDGFVQAKVEPVAGGESIDAVGAWVIVGPPDFAPGVFNLVTLEDVAFQVAVDKGELAAPASPSFTRDIQPILARAVGYQWVNRRARQGHSGNRPGHFARNWALLANPATGPAIAADVLNRLRDPRVSPIPDPAEPNAGLWMPRLHDETNSQQVLPLTRVQYGYLAAWADGTYTDDLTSPPPDDPGPEGLTRTVLRACSGGAFFPGIEAGRIMKDPATYAAPFRIDAAVVKPGQITQGNALPWQADFYACRWEPHGGGGNGLAWWPAQRPDHVLPEAAPAGPPLDWDRGISGDLGPDGLVKAWHRLGVIVERIISGQAMMVETERVL